MRLVVALLLLLPVAPAAAATEEWSPLQAAGGSTLAVALDDGTSALISVGGPDEATVYDQRRAADGTVGPATAITSVPGVTTCRPVEAATALSNFAVGVECRTDTGLEDPPTRLLELVWTGDDGWVWKVQREGVLGSVDYSPQGQYALFSTNSQYGRPHRITTYHADLGWGSSSRRELAPYGDTLVAAVTDSGDVVALRGAGSEDEPGYWDGGRLRLETYDAVHDRWTTRLDRAYPTGGVTPTEIDVARRNRLTAALVESRSTGRLNGRSDRVVVLTGTPRAPLLWSSPRWTRDVLTASAAVTRSGVGVTAWQEVGPHRTARTRLATWRPDRRRPTLHALAHAATTLTDAATAGRTLDLSLDPTGHGALAFVHHRPGDRDATATATAFGVRPRGGLTTTATTTWTQPREVTVDVTATSTSVSATLGLMDGPFYLSPLTQFSVLR